MTDTLFWVWMQQALGVGNHKVDQVLQKLGTPEALYRMSADELRRSGLFAPKEVAAIKATGLAAAKEIVRRAERLKCRLVTPDSPDFPVNLANIDCTPCVLYVLGDLSGLDEIPVLTVVGTRSSTPYGERCAGWLAEDLAAAGCVIVSGLAVGIDYAAHEGALAGGGRTIGLLGCGMDVDYPTKSNALKRRILDAGGALITEFPFGRRADRVNFNIRNRLLSGIASGVVVVQAPAKSGALNTANHANDQNRDVFAVPGEVGDESMAGCNGLISKGAKLVQDAGSILEEYVQRFPGKVDLGAVTALDGPREEPANRPRKVPRPQKRAPAAPEPAPERLDGEKLAALGLSAAAREVYCVLEGAPMDRELLAARTGLPATELLAALTELELGDLAEPLPGGRHRLK